MISELPYGNGKCGVYILYYLHISIFSEINCERSIHLKFMYIFISRIIEDEREYVQFYSENLNDQLVIVYIVKRIV
uniref:Uncharacterized protein n=1 Tax=Anguilla anguilla TaxID=7936 RepID=A0A0E9W7C3_ANGAN